MLLSSMNLVAKPKSGKGRKTEKKQIIEEKPSECEMCKKEVSILVHVTSEKELDKIFNLYEVMFKAKIPLHLQ